MQVVGYVRVSTAEQVGSGLGLEAQRAAIAAEVERRSWTLVATFEDAGASGKSLDGRPGLKAALEAVEGGQAAAIVCAKLDRLSRSLLDFAGLVERARKRGWSIVALDIGLDLTTPSGEMLAGTLAVFAQFERRLIGQRTREALAVKRSQGIRLGRPREVSAEALERIRELHAAGLRPKHVADALNAEGVPTPRGGRWHSNHVTRALRWFAEVALTPGDPAGPQAAGTRVAEFRSPER